VLNISQSCVHITRWVASAGFIYVHEACKHV